MNPVHFDMDAIRRQMAAARAEFDEKAAAALAKADAEGAVNIRIQSRLFDLRGEFICKLMDLENDGFEQADVLLNGAETLGVMFGTLLRGIPFQGQEALLRAFHDAFVHVEAAPETSMTGFDRVQGGRA